MTYGKRAWEHLDGQMRKLIPPLHFTMLDLIPAIDADTDAFNDYMASMKLPKKTEEEVHVREEAMEAALQKAVMVPLNLAKKIDSAWETMVELAAVGNITCKSDLQVGARCMETGIYAAYHNVMINVASLTDHQFIGNVTKEAEDLVQNANIQKQKILNIVQDRK